MPIIFMDDFKNLELDGRPLKDFGVHDLRRTLQGLGIPVSHSEGHYDLACKYRAWKEAEQESASAERKRQRNAAAGNQGAAIIADVKAKASA